MRQPSHSIRVNWDPFYYSSPSHWYLEECTALARLLNAFCIPIYLELPRPPTRTFKACHLEPSSQTLYTSFNNIIVVHINLHAQLQLKSSSLLV